MISSLGYLSIAMNSAYYYEERNNIFETLPYSPGERRRQGAITKAGHSHARRVLVEGAWAYRDPANVSRHLQRRLEQHPKAIQDISWKAQVRLCKRYRKLLARGTHANQVVVAIARELVGFMWAIAKQVPVKPSLVDDYCTHH